MKIAARFTLPLLFLALVCVTPAQQVHAASLTEGQIQSILGLLASFDVPESTIENVGNILYGTAANAVPFSSASSASGSPAPAASGAQQSSSNADGSSLILTSASPVLDGNINVQLTVPHLADQEYVVYSLVPVSTVAATQQGDLFSMPISFDGHPMAVYTAHMTAAYAHSGNAFSTLGVRWFPVPSGAYKILATLYGQNPFQQGSDMAYLSPVPKTLQTLQSSVFNIGSSTAPATATIDQGSLTSSSTSPVVTGTAYGLSKVLLTVCTGSVCTNGTETVSNGRWQHNFSNLSRDYHALSVSTSDGNTLLAQGTLNVTTPPPLCSMQASKSPVRIGESFIVSWTSQFADAASGADSRPAGQASITPSMAGPYTYSLSFSGRGGQTSCSVTVQVVNSGSYY